MKERPVGSTRYIASALAGADPKLKAKLYEKLGMTVRSDPSSRIVAAQSRPEIACATVSVGGGNGSLTPYPTLLGELDLDAAVAPAAVAPVP